MPLIASQLLLDDQRREGTQQKVIIWWLEDNFSFFLCALEIQGKSRLDDNSTQKTVLF